MPRREPPSLYTKAPPPKGATLPEMRDVTPADHDAFVTWLGERCKLSRTVPMMDGLEVFHDFRRGDHVRASTVATAQLVSNDVCKKGCSIENGKPWHREDCRVNASLWREFEAERPRG